MIKIARNALLLSAALSTGWACSSETKPVDIGDTTKSGEQLADYAARWEGYAEAYTFADGSDKVTLTLDTSGNGTLEIGNSPAIPGATDPNVGYPASYRADHVFSQFTALFPGFAYAVDTATVESARIRFTLNPWQIERTWCEMQTPYDIHQNSAGAGGGGSGGANGLPDGIPRGGSGGEGYVPPGYLVGPDSGGYGLSRYRCVPPDGTRYAPVSGLNPEKTSLCWDAVCACDAQSCTNYQPPAGAFATRGMLDAALDNGGNSLVGTLKIGNAAQFAVTVRLKRVPNH